MGYNAYGQLADETVGDSNVPVTSTATGVMWAAAGGQWEDRGHTLLVKTDGSLWGAGYNSRGQLGTGNRDTQYVPAQIVASGVKSVFTGVDHTLFIKTDGSLWGMGNNVFGQLGDGTTDTHDSPIQIVASGVAAAAAGYAHSLFIKSDGSLWAMGYNSNGQLGDGTTENKKTPVKIVPSGVAAVAAGGWHSLFIKTDGSLWAMGDNLSGQLGDGSGEEQHSPIRIFASGIKAAGAGLWHSMFLKSDGSLWGTGMNSAGQLGDGTSERRYWPVRIQASGVEALSCGHSHSMFIKSDGTLWGTGYNGWGQLGAASDWNNHYSPVQAQTSDVEAVFGGNRHTLFIKKSCSFELESITEYNGTLTLKGVVKVNGAPLANADLGADDPLSATCSAAFASTDGSGRLTNYQAFSDGKTWTLDYDQVNSGLYQLVLYPTADTRLVISIPVRGYSPDSIWFTDPGGSEKFDVGELYLLADYAAGLSKALAVFSACANGDWDAIPRPSAEEVAESGKMLARWIWRGTGRWIKMSATDPKFYVINGAALALDAVGCSGICSAGAVALHLMDVVTPAIAFVETGVEEGVLREEAASKILSFLYSADYVIGMSMFGVAGIERFSAEYAERLAYLESDVFLVDRDGYPIEDQTGDNDAAIEDAAGFMLFGKTVDGHQVFITAKRRTAPLGTAYGLLLGN